MTLKMESLLKRWQTSLNSYGKLDERYGVNDYDLICSFIKECENRKLRCIITAIRDSLLIAELSNEDLLSRIGKALKILQKINGDRAPKFRTATGQRERYEDITRSLYGISLKFREGKKLRNTDISILDGKDARKMRRIVEKRMCQEYHRQHHSVIRDEERGNRNRHEMKRAVSFQLYNLGGADEDIHEREQNTHWKWKYDVSLGKKVLRRKRIFDTLEEATCAAEEINRRNKNDYPVEPYKCNHCQKYHIGHNYRMIRLTLEQNYATA